MEVETKSEDNLPFLSLPVEIITKILSCNSYEHIGKSRSVCKLFNEIGSGILNSNFYRLQNVLLTRYQQIKSQMPRRESSRRNHPLAREWDIVETVHMRLTLLEMTFGKHIERKNCCFFAGEILDEVCRIYRYVTSYSNLGRAYRVTDELFELTTMATEYFRESIEPGLPDIIYFSSDLLDYSSSGLNGWKSPCTSLTNFPSSSRSNTSDDNKPFPPPSAKGSLKKRIKRLRQGMKRNNSRLVFLKRELKSSARQIGEQQRQLIEYNSKFEDYDKKFEENARKFSCIFQELNKCKTELQFWRSKSPANQLCCYCNSGQETTTTTSTSQHESAESDDTLLTSIVEDENQPEAAAGGVSVGVEAGDDDLIRCFISESEPETPPSSKIAQFVPIQMSEAADESGAGCSHKKRDLEQESTLEETSTSSSSKRQKKSLVKRVLQC